MALAPVKRQSTFKNLNKNLEEDIISNSNDIML